MRPGQRRRRELRNRWIAAGLVTLAVHGLVFLGLSQTPRGGQVALPPLVEITLSRLERTPTPPAPPVKGHAPISSPTPIRIHEPPTVVEGAEPSGFTPGPPAPPTAQPGPPQPGPPAAEPPKLKLDCLPRTPGSKRGFGQLNCEPQRYAKSGNGDEAEVGVPANVVWDAQIADRMRKHEGLRPDPPFKNDCENSNLGLGCTGDMLIPLAKKKF